ncbi:cobyric acid synthase [Paenibacillus sp. JX-17]|uniref:Cobyric acid synthase n=1 Tax=Paenibacillus lacisoli TaxID=3064525 RepID=A0ABT9CDI8_9BACL|nr:cobyric acid synthase [Paenibacillus sp. JX-17]MDO7907338.1 cobyric acid synthase [Paenibacillus sp. JX-17]
METGDKEAYTFQSGTTEKQPAGAVLMVQGTASDVGKSVITTALCRVFTQDGLRTAPFKSQNMALNSYVTADGKEIGRAQGVQAEACGIDATTDMNPVLLKPVKDMHSQIVVHGVPLTQMSAMDYRSVFLPQARGMVMEALNRLRDQYDLVIMEGAGSPAEINLKDRDIVNMNLAGWADAPVLLAADIDRGGVFASLVGTLELLEPHERQRVKGFIINKFRGDLALLQPGLDWLEQRTGIPVIGVLPHLQDIAIEAEDSVVLDTKTPVIRSASSGLLDIAVIRHPRISNFTDMDALSAEPDVALRYVTSSHELGIPDAILLPGTKDTIGDLQVLAELGLDQAIQNAMTSGTCQLVGICGGYQMLGTSLLDPEGVESGEPREAEGLGWLPLTTTFLQHKRTLQVQGETHPDSPVPAAAAGGPTAAGSDRLPIRGYEIHMGTTECQEDTDTCPLFVIETADGGQTVEGRALANGSVWGTYLHGIFDNDRFRRCWLDALRSHKGLSPLAVTFDARQRKEQEFDRIADWVREHLDMDAVYRIAGFASGGVK